MPAALCTLLIIAVLVLSLGTGAALTLGGSVIAVTIKAPGDRLIATFAALLGLVLFFTALVAAVTVAPLA